MLKAGFIRVVCELLDDEQLVVVLQIVRDSELKRAVLGLSGAMRHTLRRSPVDWQL